MNAKYSAESMRLMANRVEDEFIAPGEVDEEGIAIALALRQAAEQADALKRLLDACYVVSRYASSDKWAEFHEARDVAELASGHLHENEDGA